MSEDKELKIFCRLHKKWNHAYIVCCHIMRGTDKPMHHQKDDDGGGQIVCDRTHWPPQPGDVDPTVMCSECAQQFMPADVAASGTEAVMSELQSIIDEHSNDIISKKN